MWGLLGVGVRVVGVVSTSARITRGVGWAAIPFVLMHRSGGGGGGGGVAGRGLEAWDVWGGLGGAGGGGGLRTRLLWARQVGLFAFCPSLPTPSTLGTIPSKQLKGLGITWLGRPAGVSVGGGGPSGGLRSVHRGRGGREVDGDRSKGAAAVVGGRQGIGALVLWLEGDN